MLLLLGMGAVLLLSSGGENDAAEDARAESATPTATPTNTLTLTPLEAALQRAQAGVTRNADWEPFVQEFDGVEMVLVPAGCFMMGSENGDDDETPVHEQCFDEPFWVDRYEVTNEQYGSIGCEQWSSEPDQPRNCITWFEARDFCEQRRMRLPTEREWEYTARGPSNWVYPWGDDWDGANAVESGNSGNQTAEVGSIRSGVSWVGAMDLSGNVWEWTKSVYENYPYGPDDGREADQGGSTDVRYVMRGGSFHNSTLNLRAANRSWGNPYFEYYGLGWRCARSLE
ncbi:MAG: formylglycine-generating enzyme family protein [Deltaproteobacteria bacterium]|nr:formylglycine-generating enzyme family protein [Deltaproteobacteria bacterium]